MRQTGKSWRNDRESCEALGRTWIPAHEGESGRMIPGHCFSARFKEDELHDSVGAMECRSQGGEWVKSYDTKNGWVKGYCRKKKR